jgi:periplasmic protein CpxP/Spy
METIKKNPWPTILLTLLVIINVGVLITNVRNQRPHREGMMPPPPPPNEHRPMRPGEYLAHELQFTEVQIKKMEELRKYHHEHNKALMDDIKELKDKMTDLLKQEHPDSTAALTIAQNIGNKQKDIEMLLFRHFRDMRSICTEDQKPRFDELIRGLSRELNHKMQEPPPGRGPERD